MKSETWIIIIVVAVIAYWIGYTQKYQSNYAQSSAPTSVPTPTVSFALQSQCGVDAREYMKQSPSQVLFKSVFNNKLQICVVYTKDIFPGVNETIYNLTNNDNLGGYIFIAANSSHHATSEYWINDKNGGHDVSFEEYNNYKQSLGL